MLNLSKNYARQILIHLRHLSSVPPPAPSNIGLKRSLLANGPSLKEFLSPNAETERENHETLANQVFLDNMKKLNDQESVDLTSQIKRKVFFEVHGCQMNTNDTEVAYSILDKTGAYERTLDENTADVILLMTCSIRENAEQKIWNRLKDFTVYKNKKRALEKKAVQIGILGCMAERLKEKIVDKEKLVDVVCGPDSYRLLPSLLEQSFSTGNSAMNVQLSFEETYAEISPLRINENSKTAYISIQRGCDNMCSFVSKLDLLKTTKYKSENAYFITLM